MADITNPTAVRFSNEKIRVAADRLAQAYNFACQVYAEWLALGGTALIPNTSDQIIDGAATDGRPVITGVMANNIINRLSELKTDYEASSNAKRNTILQVATKPTQAS